MLEEMLDEREREGKTFEKREKEKKKEKGRERKIAMHP